MVLVVFNLTIFFCNFVILVFFFFTFGSLVFQGLSNIRFWVMIINSYLKAFWCLFVCSCLMVFCALINCNLVAVLITVLFFSFSSHRNMLL